VAAESIRIIHESKESEELSRARQLLEGVEKIIFLGFGFHQENLYRLFHDVEFYNHVKVRGSFYGLTDLEIKGVARRFEELSKKQIHVEGNRDRDERVLRFLRERVEFN